MSLSFDAVRQQLAAAGLEVFRSRGDELSLAERPRENLVMDSGVVLRVGEALEVLVAFCAQQTEFPDEGEVLLLERARRRAAPALSDGFVEVATKVVPVADPGNELLTIDTVYSVVCGKRVSATLEAISLLKRVLAFERG